MKVMVLGLRGFPDVQGGIETHSEHLYPIIARLGCEVDIIVRSPYQPIEVGSEWRGVRFHRIWAPKVKGLEAIVHTFLGVLYAAVKRPDILHIHAIGPSLMVPLARLFGLRVVVTHHGPDYDRQKWGGVAKFILKLGERLGMRFAHARIVISDVIMQLVREKYGVESVLIPNGVAMSDFPNTEFMLNRFDLDAGRYILMVGRIVPEKRHLDLIRAFRRAGLKGWKLVLVGDSDHPDAYMKSVIDAAQTTPDVICAGLQTGQALRELYQHAGFFVLPSSHEGLPIALLEALSYGLPAIASDIPANLEVKNVGISYFRMGDVDALAGQLAAHAGSNTRESKKEKIRLSVWERYNWNDVALQTYAVYDRLMNRR